MGIIAQRMSSVKPSAITTLATRVRQLMAEGQDIMDLVAGEPDFDTPDHIKEAAVKAIWGGETKYTLPGGTPALKEAIRGKFKRENGLEYAADEVVVSAGGKHVIFNAFLGTLDAGDEVIIPAPYWSSYPDIVALCGGTPVVVACSEADGFRLTPEALERSITPQTKWLLLNSPSNPTGAAYSAKDLAALADVVRRHPRVHVFSDDIYEHLLYGGFTFATFAQVAPDLRDRTLTMNGVSKTYSMTGWRIGYAGGPKDIIRSIVTIQAQSTSNPSSISQAAAIEALNGPQDFIPGNVTMFQRRRDLVVDAFNRIDGITCPVPEGAFYVYANCGGLIGRKKPDGGKLANDLDVAMYFLEAAKVGLVFGSAFGLGPYVRLSYAASEAVLKEAMSRITKACADLA